MYNYLYGRVTDIGSNYIVVDCGGVGYEVFATPRTIGQAEYNSEMKVYIHLHVKEDEMSLYGFMDKAEKTMFLQLISISGIGPKLALSILGGVDIKELAISIVSGNTQALNKIKGVGKKTAERIVIELKDKIESDYGGSGQMQAVSASNQSLTDGVMYLVAMGIAKGDAERKVKAVLDSEGAENYKVEDIVIKALAIK